MHSRVRGSPARTPRDEPGAGPTRRPGAHRIAGRAAGVQWTCVAGALAAVPRSTRRESASLRTLHRRKIHRHMRLCAVWYRARAERGDRIWHGPRACRVGSCPARVFARTRLAWLSRAPHAHILLTRGSYNCLAFGDGTFSTIAYRSTTSDTKQLSVRRAWTTGRKR
eukprot:4238187-Prymnesium_polylepis.2